MNKKPTILAVAALGSLAMIGTGFAGWVIATEVQATAEGSVTAMAVTDGRVSVSILPKEGVADAAVIKFGKPAQPNQNRAYTWFDYDDAEDTVDDKLTATFTVTVTFATGVVNRIPAIAANPTLVVTEGQTNRGTEFNAQITTNQVIAAPTYSFGDFTRSENVLTADLVITFAYGEHFKVGDNVVHPYDFYGSHAVEEKVGEVTTNYGDDAVTYMGYLKSLSGYAFGLTFSFTDAGVGALGAIAETQGTISAAQVPNQQQSNEQSNG